jgi:uncharacterized protein
VSPLPPAAPQAEPTAGSPNDEERVLAGLSHVALFVGLPVVGPVAIYFIKREQSRFVAFHALQATFLALAAVPAVIVSWVFTIVLELALLSSMRAGALDLLVPLSTLGCFGLPLLVIALTAVTAGVSAFQGRTWKIPVVGSFAEGILNAGPHPRP